ncbi:hypothetical protein HK099_005422 [Clydaea vesicula]|uniref:Uncharacterized protein n=1 Tax=Clydaea vesicula TaxID=447962 RepID=A0AAD5XXM2_9FUNG|nr:hypothetical protein HK099_005422 [Clydaea vesicula]KAJ3386505.1 hypothetical protein HDU92_002415 [Lobulomyces angularis]
MNNNNHKRKYVDDAAEVEELNKSYFNNRIRTTQNSLEFSQHTQNNLFDVNFLFKKKLKLNNDAESISSETSSLGSPSYSIINSQLHTLHLLKMQRENKLVDSDPNFMKSELEDETFIEGVKNNLMQDVVFYPFNSILKELRG